MRVFRDETKQLLQIALGALCVCMSFSCGTTPTTGSNQRGYQPYAGGPSLLPAATAGRLAVPSGVGGSGAAISTGVTGAAAANGGIPRATAGAPGLPPSAAAGTAAPPAGPDGGANQTLPCNVTKALTSNCVSCHGATPIGGAPMSLVTYADLHKPAVTMPTLKVFELAKMRLNDKMRPMPPGGAIAAADFTALDTWLGAGATAGTAADANCVVTPPSTTGGPGSVVEGDGTTGPLTALPGETCYDFKTHQSTTSVDATPYDVGNGEHYEQFYFKAPWPTGAVATRYGAKYDNIKVLHHWLLFSTTEDNPDGYHVTAPLPTLIGVNAQLIAGWAVGGTNLAMPADVGFELPPKGTQLNVQWHFYNSTNMPQTDTSSVQVCTVPAGMRKNTATITWLGTEDLNGNKWFGGAGMPAHAKSTFSGTCSPLRAGMNSTDPIHIFAFWPHMHQLGINMKATVNHKSGMKETVFDKPFDFNHQVHYMQPYDLMPGDTITASCDFNNTTNMGIPFGESTDTEMCYLFTYSYPAHSLENGASSLIGATNACW